MFADPVYGGRGYIAGEAEGIVTVGGQPAERKILLFERRNFKVIRTQWSKADGSYRFDYLNPNKEFLMVALDHKKQYEPVSYDFIKPFVDTDGG
ncbi:hypothetical protein [Neisseria sp. HMSC064E01]|uniref:hypothetical protein n=1 Tax=Neisseria sp. HMSC064E01 TaxID=1715052 RepID=UPI001FEDB204|nr:hypothetical protein [Neisseria sp. HMSC064E01]